VVPPSHVWAIILHTDCMGTMATSGINVVFSIYQDIFIVLVHTYQGRDMGILYTQPWFCALVAFLEKWPCI
jgi:hypothetical protein